MTTVAGIDEAGRGCVIGPLVIAGAMFDEKDLDKLKKMGVKDSKLLKPEKREELYPKIKALAKDSVVLKVSAKHIDELRAAKVNLNRIEAEHMAQIIKALAPDIAQVDAPQVSTDKFKAILLELAKNHTEIIAENYADKKYVSVGAASILAKVERDREIEEIKKKVGVDFGVGYPHDERTIKFVEKCLKEKKHLEYIRHSWMTVTNMQAKKKQKSLGEY